MSSAEMNQTATAEPAFISIISLKDANLMLKEYGDQWENVQRPVFVSKRVSDRSSDSFSAEAELQSQHVTYSKSLFWLKSHKYKIWNNSSLEDYKCNFKGKQKTVFGYQCWYMFI